MAQLIAGSTIDGDPIANNPMTAEGDMVIGDINGVPKKLAKGTASQVLTMDPVNDIPYWATNMALPPGIGPVPYVGIVAPTGWIFTDGKTIGNASSGATGRANADTINLFTLLWDSTTNIEFPIQDSTGGASTRGASAAADFAANKRFPLPDVRGRTVIGLDNLGGTSANRITDAAADLVGGVLGTETHTQTGSAAADTGGDARNGDGGVALSYRGHSHSITVNDGLSLQPSYASPMIISL